MINASGAFRQALAHGYKDYIERTVITLANGTKLTLDNSNLWQGGFTVEDAVSSNENSFSSLGSAIINSATLVINNVQDNFSEYDFTGADVVLYVGLEINGANEMLKKGTYTVEEATYNGVLITLKLIDYMAEFDKPYSDSALKYPATCDSIIRDACTNCGITLSASSLNFPHKDTVIQARPDDDKEMTFREVISYVSTICGCFAKVDVNGELVLKWFNQDLLERLAQGYDGGQFDGDTPYSTGDSVDGGTFNPWDTGDEIDGGDFRSRNGVHYISSMYSSNIGVDDVVITGVTIEYEIKGEKTTETVVETVGTEDYAVKVSKNPFITADNIATIKARLGEQLIGLKFRKASLSHGSDPTIEAGDVAFVIDRKNNVYPILISRTVFRVGGAQKTICGASTPKRNSASRYTEQTKSYATLRRELKEQSTAYDKALEELAKDIANANGLYETQVETESGGVITYMHNKTKLADSDIQIVISDVGVTVTANGTAEHPTWYGLRVNGELIASILNTVGVNADWINTGQLVIKKGSKEMFFADVDTGDVRITGDSVSITAGDPISTAISTSEASAKQYADNKVASAVSTFDDSLTQQEVFNRLTNDGSSQGIFLENGQLYINMSYLQTGTLKIGGTNNTNGVLEVYDSSGTRVGVWNNNALYIGNVAGTSQNPTDSNTSINTSGAIVTKSLSANEYVRVNGNNTSSIKIPWSSGSVSLNLNGLSVTYSNDGTNYLSTTTLSTTESQYSGTWGALTMTRDMSSSVTRRGLLCGYELNLSYAVSSNVQRVTKVRAEGISISASKYIDINMLDGRITTDASLSVSGTKNRSVQTNDYGKRLLYSYETPSPLFGDVGEGVISDDGKCYVWIDSIFAETITLSQYQVFLQKYGDGDCWVSQKTSAYFVVEGTPSLKFGWELKAKQSDFDQYRLEKDETTVRAENRIDYAIDFENHLTDIMREREVSVA